MLSQACRKSRPLWNMCMNETNTVMTSLGKQLNVVPSKCAYYSSTARVGQAVEWHGTTILCVKKGNQICMMGDGQVSMGSVCIKPNAKKIRLLTPKAGGEEKTVVGFAGSTADAFTLLERLESKLDEYGHGQLTRSCVELAKGWRTDKYLRRLEASLLVANANGVALEITGNGDVLESSNGVLAIGSGGNYAMAAARALQTIPDLTAEQVATQSMQIAADMCVYTNHNFLTETLEIAESNDESSDT